MSEQTRVVRLGSLVERDEATNENTRIGRLTPDWLNVRGLFNSHHHELALALQGEARPGVMVFVISPSAVEGRLWLAATDELRSGTVGRHGSVDLHLPKDDSMSLRHCLVLVRRRGDGVRIHVVDLGSSAGLRVEDHTRVHAVDADGHFFLLVPGGVLAFFPTGVPLPWNPEAFAPFDTLARRKLSPRIEQPRSLWRQLDSSEATHDTVRAAPAMLGADLLAGEQPAGRLTVVSPVAREKILVGAIALDRGVILGRNERCAGCSALGEDSVSRVHALLLRRDEDILIVDTGSRNGTWLGRTEIRCAPLDAGATYRLGNEATICWEALH